jgi:uncharacterized membrane protein YjgN (DUF898 family)
MDSTIVVIAILAVLAVLGAVAVTVLIIAQQAEARGCPLNTPAPNAAKGRCFRG